MSDPGDKKLPEGKNAELPIGIGNDDARDSAVAATVAGWLLQKAGDEAAGRLLSAVNQAHTARNPLIVFVAESATEDDCHVITLDLRNVAGHGLYVTGMLFEQEQVGEPERPVRYWGTKPPTPYRGYGKDAPAAPYDAMKPEKAMFIRGEERATCVVVVDRFQFTHLDRYRFGTLTVLFTSLGLHEQVLKMRVPFQVWIATETAKSGERPTFS